MPPTRPMSNAPIIAAAPMMAVTDRHFRYLLRLISPHARLFTEMVSTSAMVHGSPERLLAHHPAEAPVVLQLGGNDPATLAHCTALGADAGYDEINLNVGCPSNRVQEGRIGACLMREPELVAECVEQMRRATSKPISVKCRLGLDGNEDPAFLDRFIHACSAAGVETFYVHARIAVLNGLSPAQNRSVPPLRYEQVYRLKSENPQLTIVINGGFADLPSVTDALAHVDGVMIGRAVQHDPMLLAELDQHLLAATQQDRFEIYRAYVQYAAAERRDGVPLQKLTRHVLGLFNGRPGARRFRQVLSDAARLKANDLAVFDEALAQLAMRDVA